MGSIHPAIRRIIVYKGLIPEDLREKFPRLHFCPDWDYLLINDDDQEFECCGCYYHDNRHWVAEQENG